MPSPRKTARLTPADFIGTWRVRRKIVDYRAGTSSVFAGTAVITAESFEEKGQLTLNGAVFNSARSYRLRFGPRSVEVSFPDGSDFIRLGDGAVQVTPHLCGRDDYAGRFFFTDRDTWAEVWRVTGPQKHYASVSRYVRVSVEDT